MLSRRLFLRLGGAFGLGGCLGIGCGPTEIEDVRRNLLISWGNHFLLPLYRDFEMKAAELDAQARAMCAAPAVESLAGAQSAWWQARQPWKEAQVFSFGPYIEEPLRLGPKIDFWPVRPDTIEAILSGPFPLTPDSGPLLGASAKGFAAIEYLLYQPGINLVAEFSTTRRRCEYVLALTADLVVQAGQMRKAWDPQHGNYLAQLAGAGRGSTKYDSLQMALGVVVNRMAFTIEDIRSDKLGGPAGAATGGVPQPDKTESRFSGRSLEDIRDNLRGVERMYYGNEPEGEIGLDFLLRHRGHDFAGQVRSKLDASYAALDAIDPPLTQAVQHNPAEVMQAVDRLGDLQRFIQVDILSGLALTLSFNDSDGD